VSAEKYRALPQITAGDPRPRRRRTGPVVRCVSTAVQIHYRRRQIGIGQRWEGQEVAIIESAPDPIVVFERDTGAVLRELTVGPADTYHPSGRKRGQPRQNPRLQPDRQCQRCPDNTVSGMSPVLPAYVLYFEAGELRRPINIGVRSLDDRL